MAYENDPDVAAFLTGGAVSAKRIPTKEPTIEQQREIAKKKKLTDANPQLQAEAQSSDYATDPDVAAFLSTNKQATQQEGGMLPSWLKGGAEAALHTAAGALAFPVSAGAGIYGTLTSGKFGTQEGIKAGEAKARQVQEAMLRSTQPTTQEGQDYLAKMQSAFEASKLPPVMPEALGMRTERKLAGMAGENAANQLQTQFGNIKKPTLRVEPTMQSGGAAAAVPENVLRGNIDAALANATPELQAHIQSRPVQSVNIPALETRALEEKHGVNLLTSQRTGDTQGYSEAWNQRSKNGLVADFEQQPKQLANAFETSKQRHAPDIPSTADASELGQITINSLAAKDKIRQQAISSAYKALEDANGGQFPIDTGKLKQNIDAELLKKYKSRYLSEGISGDLDQFLQSPTFEGFEALRTNLADEMRSAKDGKTRQAAFIVRDELEKLPIFGEESGSPQAIQLKALADNARKLHVERKKIIENNPAYKAAIKESANLDDAVAQGESLNADKFHQKFVSNASPEAIRRMKAELAPDDLANQAIAFAELERTKRAITNANETRVKADTFADYLRKNKSVLREALPPDAMQDVMEIGLLNSKIGKPDAGTFNYSNSWSSMMGDLAKEGLLGLGEAKLAAATSGASIPAVGGLKMMFEKMNKDAFANNQRNPYGGLIKENSKPTRIELRGMANKEK